MLSYEKILLYYAIPYFSLSIVIELLYARWKGETIRMIDAVSSLSSGMINILKAVLGLSISILSYGFLLKHLQLFHWQGTTVWMVIFCFFCIDLAGYWVHRIEHVINFFWNHHIIHHSSEEFNLACALRQPFSDFVSYFTIFYIPMALLGIPVLVIGIVAPVHLFMQFWYHTRYINRMGILEKVIVTPSHHRVHHAMNPEYMDKNFGQIFIFWDKLFGTYQEELPDVAPVYGVKRPVKTWNPFLINFKHLYLLLSDAWRTASYRDKARIWFMPTGWRPADVAEKYPVYYVDGMDEFEKFDPGYSAAFTAWALLQMIATLALLCFFFYRSGSISHTESVIYGGFLLLSVFAYTSVMDKKAYGVVATMIQTAIAIGVILETGDWFGLKNIWAAGPTMLIIYFSATVVSSIYFQFTEFSRKDETQNLEMQ